MMNIFLFHMRTSICLELFTAFELQETDMAAGKSMSTSVNLRNFDQVAGLGHAPL